MLTHIEQKIVNALSKNNPIESLRTLVIQLNKDGISKNEIVKIFYSVDNMLRTEGKTDDSDLLEDVIDMMTGYYVGKNIELK